MLVMENKTTYLRRDLAVKLLKLLFSGDALERIDYLPQERFPKERTSARCCIFKDRAMVSQRLMALMGLSLEDEKEEPSLRTYLEKALAREKVEGPVLTVLQDACSSCIRSHYHPTDLCRGCVAQPCTLGCPKNAITIKNGRARIDEELCVNCGICQGLCPYNAIAHTPVPCEEQCPVGAVKKDGRGREYIDFDRCISCGRCTRSCPFGAVMERSQLIDVAKRLMEDIPMTVLLAPSFAGQYPGKPLQTVAALRKMGFSAVYDVAAFAEETARREAAEHTERCHEGQCTMGTSCCPAYVEAVEKHVPEFKPMVSETPTPMALAASYAREKDPEALTVFIGPCIAKKQEGLKNVDVDFVLTFEELGAFFLALGLEIAEMDEESFDGLGSGAPGRGFALSQGVSRAVEGYLDDGKELKGLVINGLDKKGLNQLKIAGKGKFSPGLIEVMSCKGGCLYGPGVAANPASARKVLETHCTDTALVEA